MPAEQRGATWGEVGSLRSSINEAMQKARLAGDKKAEATLVAQKQAIDGAIARDLSPEAQAAWLEANASHAAKMDRFHTGPQASIFRTSPNGEPAVQGGEVAGKFWGARPGLAGLWNTWTDKATGEIVESYTMLTLNADSHELMRRMHKPEPKLQAHEQDERSVVPIPLADIDQWLFGSQGEAQQLIALPVAELFDAGPMPR